MLARTHWRAGPSGVPRADRAILIVQNPHQPIGKIGDLCRSRGFVRPPGFAGGGDDQVAEIHLIARPEMRLGDMKAERRQILPVPVLDHFCPILSDGEPSAIRLLLLYIVIIFHCLPIDKGDRYTATGAAICPCGA